ncbi:MAG: type II secretion system protein GspN [Deltaproteobacteria bacterium]|nr:type II secretion system protein GspN [Deltaproteobacteria bacterium]
MRHINGLARGRRIFAALGILLFALIFLFTFLYTLPGDAFLSPLRSALSRAGYDLTYENARIVFPLGVECRNAVLSPRGGAAVSFDSVLAAFEWTGLFRWLPFHLRATRGTASVDIRTSPMVSDPGKVRLRVSRIGSDDLAAFYPPASGVGFLIDSVDLQLKRSGGGRVSGTGDGSVQWLRMPIPAKESPVREALLKDVRMKFVVREGTIHVSSFTGTYEGSAVDGTGEIVRFSNPAAAAITFHLRIQNPLEGKIAALFDLVAKNVKNANLRIKGTLLSPTGEFQFF